MPCWGGGAGGPPGAGPSPAEPRLLPPCGAAAPDLIPAAGSGSRALRRGLRPRKLGARVRQSPAPAQVPPLLHTGKPFGRKAKPILTCPVPLLGTGTARDEDTGMRSRLSSQGGDVPGVRQRCRRGLSPEFPRSPLLPPIPHCSLTPPWPPASAAAAGASRRPAASLDAGCKSPLRREQRLSSPLSGSMGAGPRGCQHRNSPGPDGCVCLCPKRRDRQRWGEGHPMEPGVLWGAALVLAGPTSLSLWEPCSPPARSRLISPNTRAPPVPRFNGIFRHKSVSLRGGWQRDGPWGDEGSSSGCRHPRTRWGAAGPTTAATWGPGPATCQGPREGSGLGAVVHLRVLHHLLLLLLAHA